MNPPEVVFWFHAPPRVGRGAFNHLSKTWGNRVTYACTAAFTPERLAVGWDAGDYGLAELVHLSNMRSPDATIDELINRDPRAIHIFAGFQRPMGDLMLRVGRTHRHPRVVVFSERPGYYGPPLRRTLKRLAIPVVHRSYYHRYGDLVSAYLPLGELGVAQARRYGWPPDRLYPFMYCPELPDLQPVDARADGTVRILYVGRFARWTKGTDTLLRAVEMLRPGSWSLDLIGGYGDFARHAVAWSEAKPFARYHGSWPADDVCRRMLDFDIVVVPSRFDGWNVVVNEAIHAGLAVVVSDEAVSHEMVATGQCGAVVPANDPTALSAALQRAIDDPDLIDRWKANAANYAPRASAQSVGRYLVDILETLFLQEASHPKPQCPWL